MKKSVLLISCILAGIFAAYDCFGEEVPSAGTASGTYGFKVEDGRINLTANRAPRLRVLESLAESLALAAEIDPNVSGEVTVEMDGVHWKEALESLAGAREVEYDYAYGSGEKIPVKITVGTPEADRLTTDDTVDWEGYYNTKWDFFCQYPSHWTVKTVISNPGSADGVIKEKIEFRNPAGALFWFDVWENSAGLGLMEWFNRHFIGLLAEPTAPPLKKNALIDGRPALVIIHRQILASTQIITIWQEEDLVFTLTYPAGDRLQSKPVYDRILSSFELHPEN